MNLPVIASTFILSSGGRFVFSPVKLHPISSSLVKIAKISRPMTFRYRDMFEVIMVIWSGVMNADKDSQSTSIVRGKSAHTGPPNLQQQPQLAQDVISTSNGRRI